MIRVYVNPAPKPTSGPVDSDVMRVNKLAVFALYLVLGLAALAIVAVKLWKRDNWNQYLMHVFV